MNTLLGIAALVVVTATLINSAVIIALLHRTDPRRTTRNKWNIENLAVADPEEFARAVDKRKNRLMKLRDL